jgi:hypothetical protein
MKLDFIRIVMKYFVYNDLVTDCDEIERSDIHIYQAPDNFLFDINLIKNFFEYKNIEYDSDERFYWNIKSHNLYFDLNWLINKENYSKKLGIEKGEFVEWLKSLGVEEVKYELIE